MYDAWYNKLYDYVNTALGLLNPVSKITAIGAVAVAAVQGRWDDLKHDWDNKTLNPFNQDASKALDSKTGGTSIDYYSTPWERIADLLGGVNRGNYKKDSLQWGIVENLIGPIVIPFYFLFGF